MSLTIQGYEPYYSAFPSVALNMVVKLNSLMQPIYQDQIIGFNCWWRTAYFAQEDLADINQIVTSLNSEMTIGALADATGFDYATVQSLIETLYELGIVNIVEAEQLPALSFYRHVVASMRSRRHKTLLDNPLIHPDQPSALNKRLLLGLLVEGYHFSSSAASHISLAIAQTRNKAIEDVLSRYLSEEFWHGTLLAKGIIKAGISKEELCSSIPTFPVLGIINFLRHIARTDIQAYGICVALTESNTSSNALLIHKEEIWDFLKTLELVPDETLDAFFEHDKLDYNLKHDDVPGIIFQTEEKISSERQKELLQTAAIYIEMIADAYRYLKAHYASEDGRCCFMIE